MDSSKLLTSMELRPEEPAAVASGWGGPSEPPGTFLSAWTSRGLSTAGFGISVSVARMLTFGGRLLRLFLEKTFSGVFPKLSAPSPSGGVPCSGKSFSGVPAVLSAPKPALRSSFTGSLPRIPLWPPLRRFREFWCEPWTGVLPFVVSMGGMLGLSVASRVGPGPLPVLSSSCCPGAGTASVWELCRDLRRDLGEPCSGVSPHEPAALSESAAQ